MSKAVVIFSGGQDSTTCLGWAKNRYDGLTAVSFVYGQQHSVEITQAGKIAGILDVPIQVVDISFYSTMVKSALFGEGDINAKHEDQRELPASYVPNRNTLFIVLAHSIAQTAGADTLITGVCQTDYSGYPDCREDFIREIESAINLGSNCQIEIATPLMHLTKAETFRMAQQEGVLDLVINESHTCYTGNRTLHEWGRGCGDCPACRLRSRGFEQYQKQYGEERCP